MNKNFDYVIKSPLNKSKTKEAHLFAQSKRFNQPRLPNCAKDSYDLSGTMIASVALLSKSTIFPREERFKHNKSTSPSPNAYHHRSFVELNSSIEKGNTFGHDKKLSRVNKDLVPGPGAYHQTYNPEKKLSYTMRSRVIRKNHGSKLGPGQYQIEGYSSVTQFNQIHSKYANIKSIKLGTDTRFKEKWHLTLGNGPAAYSNSRIQIGYDPKYSFGNQRKTASYIKSNKTPGPGSYNEFSEFSQLEKGRSIQYL